MSKVIVTGPECSGKTTLCKALSKYFKIPISKEYAREYLKKLGLKYIQEDLIEIAKEQLKYEEKNQLLDTDLITIKIWSDYKYNRCDDWILKEIKKQKYKNRFYLLCKPDISWQKDPLRENPINRMEIFDLYKKELDTLEHNYYIIKGKNRTTHAIAKILDKNLFF